MTSVARPKLQLNQVKPDFSPTLDALSARDISSLGLLFHHLFIIYHLSCTYYLLFFIFHFD